MTRRKIEDLRKRLGLASWLEIKVAERVLSAHENQKVLEHKTRLDGCYVLKTDLPTQCASKELKELLAGVSTLTPSSVFAVAP